jgi:hypothetical protein
MIALRFADESNHQVVITVEAYEVASATNAHDANWLRCSVVVEAGAFRGTAGVSFTTHDFSRFLVELDQALAGQRSLAVFEPLEGALVLRLEFDRAGHATVRGRLLEQRLGGAELSFCLETAHSSLVATRGDLRRVVAQFPERSDRLHPDD